MSIEPLHVTSSPIDNSFPHSKIVSQYKCMPHLSHSHNSSRISAQMGASPLGLYYGSCEEMQRWPYKVSDQGHAEVKRK